MDLAGEPVRQHLQRGHQVEAQERQVGVVVAGEGLAAEVGVHQPQAAQSVRPRPGAAHVGERQLLGVPDHHPLDLPLAVEQHPHLAVDLARDLGEVPPQLGGDHLGRVGAAAVGAAQGVELALLEAEDVPEDVPHSRAIGSITPPDPRIEGLGRPGALRRGPRRGNMPAACNGNPWPG